MNRYLHVIYCDDVRNEVRNKISLIGIYNADLLVSEMPVVLPQLFLVLSVVTDAAEPVESLTITITRDEEQLAEITPSADDLANVRRLAQATKPSGEPSQGLNTIGVIFKIAPFPIEKPSVLRVKAKTEREELHGPGLRIGLDPTVKAQAAIAASAPAETPLH